MPVRAVVLDIGGVLEVVDDSVFPDPALARLRLERAAFDEVAAGLRGNPVIGELTEAEIREHYRAGLGLTDAQAHELMEDMWRWYVGELDVPLRDWFAGLHERGLLLGILSNSSPGARERERCWGFEDLVDVLIYSHEVGVMKPHPEAFRLTERLLGLAAREIVFLDDVPGHVEAARAAGWHAVHHTDTATSIAAVERLLADQA